MKKPATTFQELNTHPRGLAESTDITEEILERTVLLLNANILGIVFGLVAGIIIFASTNFLILKGGEVIGPHLSLLRNFFPFYSVTFLGSIVGFGYGLLTGYIAGFIIGSIYNLVVKLKSGK